MHEGNLARTWRQRTTTAMLKRLLLGSVALVFAASCTNDGNKNLVGPSPKGLAHIPSFSTSSATPSGATFTTDKDVYAPGETVNLSGTGWQPADVLDIHLDGTPQNHPPIDWTVTVGDDGSFRDGTYVVQDSDAGTIMTVTATSQADPSETATASFDPPPPPSGSLCNTPAATDCAGATSLPVRPGNTHYAVTPGATIVGKIVGAPDLGTATSVSVFIKSTDFGNTTLTGTVSGTTITFTWTVPTTGVCNTTIVAYKTLGNGANNDIIDNGVRDGTANAAAGYAVVDANGDVITDCGGGGGQATGPGITKDAAGSYDNTYAWSISKDVDKTIVKQIGGSATFNYTIKVTHDGGTISDVKVTGTITVNNPNPDPIDIDGVSDKLSDGTICTVTSGGAQALPSGNTNFAYSCSISGSSVPSGLTNKATVTWSEQTLSPSGDHLAAGSADFTYPTSGGISFTGNDIDECVAVTDTYAGSLGQACVGDANPKTFTYSRTIPVPQFDCLSYDNTATFTTNDNGLTGSAGQTVKVCGPAKTGALTIGFWKTTNGQNLIKTYCANTLDDYLAGLGYGSGPFSDAAGKTCSQLATYVYSILNGASASNMNSMLKAQMLGTALDVWFSGPGWTSTKSGGVKPPSNFLSHNNLGTFNMDLTAVCPMVDNLSTGTATCLNNTPSTDAVAAGAVPTSPMSMQAILDFAAATPSPFNGSVSSSVWYAGSRTKQEILKNIFDQFNNQLAFGSF